MASKVALLRPEVYGITGEKGHGKDTFAKLVLEQSTSFQVFHFAAALKTLAGKVCGLSEEQMSDPSLKETPLGMALPLDLFLAALRRETALDLQPRAKIAYTPREVLQYLGTEYVRTVQQDYWVQHLLQRIHAKRRVLVPDVRFPDEEAGLRSIGGLIIKVVRIDAPLSQDAHPSEVAIREIRPDLTIGARTGDLSLPRRVASLIARNKFENALQYDYTRAKEAISSYTSGVSAEASARLLGTRHSTPYCLYALLDYYGVPRRKQDPKRVPHRFEDGVEYKVCSECSVSKSIKSFNSNIKAWDGLSSLCRECASVANKERYRRYGRVQGLSAIFNYSVKSAKQRGVPFDLPIEDMYRMWEHQEGRCAYSGRSMTLEAGSPLKASLDRIDSNLGYTPDNVVLCCLLVNLMKRNLTMDEFRSVIRDLAQHLDVQTTCG
jgi:hypothetical protein